jgi:hypothetical protein
LKIILYIDPRNSYCSLPCRSTEEWSNSSSSGFRETSELE